MKSIDSLGVMTFKPWLPYHIETVKIDEAKIDYKSNGFLHTLFSFNPSFPFWIRVIFALGIPFSMRMKMKKKKKT